MQQQLKASDKTCTVGATSTLILPVNAARVWASIVVDGTVNVYLRLGEAAVINTGIHLNASGGTAVFDVNMPWTGEIYGIAASSSVVTAQDVSAT